jgi:hypothetical protein
VGRGEISDFGFRISDFVNPSPFFLLVWFAGVEDYAIARFEWGDQSEHHGISPDFGDFTKKHAAFFAEARVNEFLVVIPAEPAGEQAPRKGHLDGVFTIYDF